jgi:hypothetical protein
MVRGISVSVYRNFRNLGTALALANANLDLLPAVESDDAELA